jgi:hypothetical protein
MENLRIVYKKPTTKAFITIESKLVGEDEDYLYLDCGKYIKTNIISITKIQTIQETVRKKDLKDDA